MNALQWALTNPVFVTHAPGDENRLFVIEKAGAIKIIDLNSKAVSGTFMTVTDTKPQGEGGLIGMAFHPNYFNEGETGFGKFYVYTTVENGGIPIDGETSPFTSRIREYSVTANPNVADAATKNEVLSWVKPRDNHNGGWIGFNPVITPGEPQYLYINSGDGGKQGDPDNNAQTIVNEKLGKVSASTSIATTSPATKRATTRSRQPIPSSASPATTRSGRMAFAIRGAEVSTVRLATIGLATSATARAKKSAWSNMERLARSTSAGNDSKETLTSRLGNHSLPTTFRPITTTCALRLREARRDSKVAR